MQLDEPNPYVTLECDAQHAHMHHLDVRALLEAGGDPYHIIMGCVRQLTRGERLVIHALFEPQPLMAQLRRMGYTFAAEHIGVDHWGLTVAPPGDQL